MLTYTTHTRWQMKRRGIDELDVRMAWLGYHTEKPGTHLTKPTVVRIGPAANGDDLCVVVDQETPSLVITAYWRNPR